MNCIKSLDKKETIVLLDCLVQNTVQQTKLIPKVFNNSLMTIDGMLNDAECENVLKNIASHFVALPATYDPVLRDGQRILAFDKSGELIETIERRIRESCAFKSILSTDTTQPYGFGTGTAEWQITGSVNPLIRFNQYSDQSVGFAEHYDAQYIGMDGVRSAWTLLIYLDDNDSTTDFIQPNGAIISIACKTGTCCIFDQRLKHRGSAVKRGTKTVLRTDILVRQIGPMILSDSERVLKNKAIQLFRQAEYLELAGNPNAQQLYDAALHIRVTGQPPDTMPEIELMVRDIVLTPNLVFRGRMAGQYIFGIMNQKMIDFIKTKNNELYKSHWNITFGNLKTDFSLKSHPEIERELTAERQLDDMIRLAGFFCVSTETSEISDDVINWKDLVSEETDIDVNQLDVDQKPCQLFDVERVVESTAESPFEATNKSRQWTRLSQRSTMYKKGDMFEGYQHFRYESTDPMLEITGNITGFPRDDCNFNGFDNCSCESDDCMCWMQRCTVGISCQFTGCDTHLTERCAFGGDDCDECPGTIWRKRWVPRAMTGVSASYKGLTLEVVYDCEDHCAGKIICRGMSETFNHASCQSRTYVSGIEEESERYINIQYDMNFEIDSDARINCKCEGGCICDVTNQSTRCLCRDECSCPYVPKLDGMILVVRIKPNIMM